MSGHRILLPPDWPPPKGYADGILAEGRSVWIAGQIGRNTAGVFAPDLPGQIEQALRNIITVLATAGGAPEHIVRLTWYLVDIADYETRIRDIGAAYRRVMGRHFPTMSVVQITRLVERQALAEIEATAVLPHEAGPS